MRVGAGLALLLAAATPALAQPNQPATPARPNIVLLVADDWGFTDVGAFGGEIATPHLDALAHSGVRFSNFHVAASCAPTRAMLQTGLTHHRAGLGNMPETIPPAHRGQPGYETHLRADAPTIAERLKPAGYRSLFVGKWHLGHTPDTLPGARGYARAFALSQSGADNFESLPNKLLYEHADWTEDGKPAAMTGYSSSFLVDKAIEYLGPNPAANGPFFLTVQFLANHIPVQAPDADIARYRGRYDQGWTALRAARRTGAAAAGLLPAATPMVTMDTTANWAAQTPAQKFQRARAMEAYAGMATALDREIGRLIAHLEAQGLAQNTIFVFLSDNGPEAIDPLNLGPRHNRWIADFYYDITPEQQGRPGSFTAIGAGFASAAASPFRGYKFSGAEGGLRVPLIIAWPGHDAVKPGHITHALTMASDITPTLLDLAGVQPAPAAPAFAGRPLTPLLNASASRIHPPDAAIGYELSGNAALFKGDLKLSKNLPPYGDGQWHLYDIVQDPGETRDLAQIQPSRMAELQADYARFAKADGVLAMPPGYSAPDQIQANALSDLLWPRLRALLPWALALILLPFAALRLRRRVKTA